MSRALPRPLYLMIKPPIAVADRLAVDVRTKRPADLLHITLLMLGDRRDFSDFAMHKLVEALDHVHLPRFRLAFDGIHESARTVALRGSQRNEGACQFQAALRRGLMRQGIALPGYKFHPHMTLAYSRDGQGSEAIDAISWLVDEFCLIESVPGEDRHIEHGRFALMPPPFALATGERPSIAPPRARARPRDWAGRTGMSMASPSSPSDRQLALF